MVCIETEGQAELAGVQGPGWLGFQGAAPGQHSPPTPVLHAPEQEDQPFVVVGT